MVRLRNRIFYVFNLLVLSICLLTCDPDRFPVTPEEYETRRPQVGYVIPISGDTVSTDTFSTIHIWFDELMDENTIYETVFLSLTTSDEEWIHLDYVNYMDQSQTEPNFIVISRDALGSFYSPDQGNSWIFIKSLAELAINFIKIDPANSSLIYAATDSVLIKSTDAGENWQIINNNLPTDLIIMHLSFDSANSAKLWLATSAGIFKSFDGGENWNTTGELPSWIDQEITQIAIDTENTSIIYASTLGRFIYKSIDDGLSWEMKRGDSDVLGTSRIYDIAVDPDSSHILYAASINQGIYKSVDAGDNWLRANNGIDDLNARIIHFHRTDGNRLYLATGVNIYVSNDNAQSWQEVSDPTDDNIRTFFGDSQSSSTLFIATSNQIFKSDDRGGTWIENSLIESSSIQIEGTFSFSTWQDTLEFIEFDEEDRADTIIVVPYRYDDALAAYDAGLISEPPVEPNPKATKVEFSPVAGLYQNWRYRFHIRGAFEGNVWRGEYGARDLSGMSLQYDKISNFITK